MNFPNKHTRRIVAVVIVKNNCSGNGCNNITSSDDDIDAESIKECK